jgi:nuclear transport factor 2 (NTF2) superfamily protein
MRCGYLTPTVTWPSGTPAINDVRIAESERLFRWLQGRRPSDHPGLTELGL